MSNSNKICTLTCPLCGAYSCPIFYGFSIIYPNFDFPKRLNIELKYICTQNNNKISSIELSRYLEIIDLNSKFNGFAEIDINYNFIIKNSSDRESLEEIQKVINNINEILIKTKNIYNINKDVVNNFNYENKDVHENIKFFLARYLELNDDLFIFLEAFLNNIRDFQIINLVKSFYYMNKLLNNFEFMNNRKLYLTNELIEDFINTNDIIKLPFLFQLNKQNSLSHGKEILRGHTLPIVGLKQIKNELIVSGSFGFIKIWKQNKNFKSENYSFYEIFETVNYNSKLIQCIIELEDNIIAFSKGNQIVEGIISKDPPEIYKELFSYQVAENTIESLTSLNNHQHLVAGLYTKMYIYERKNKLPIYSLQYHEFFIKRLISIPVLNLFCSAGSDYKIILYDSKKFEFYNAFTLNESHIIGLCNYNDTDFCASTMQGKIWYFKWNKENNIHEEIGPINAHTKEIYGITQINNGNVVSVSRDSFIKIWDINKQICLYKVKAEPNDLVCQLNDGRLCCASHNHIIPIYNYFTFVKNHNLFLIKD